MGNWFEFKVQFDKTTAEGLIKKVTEPYLVDALSFTEAEARAVEEIKPYVSGEFAVVDIKRTRLAEIIVNNNGDRYFKGKVQYITLDEKSGAEKLSSVNMLVLAEDIESAIENLKGAMADSLSDWKLASIAETPIMDVFPYKAAEGGAE